MRVWNNKLLNWNLFSRSFKTLLLLITIYLIPIQAQSTKWQEAAFYPGSKIIFNKNVNFSECYFRLPTNYNLWFNCEDKDYKLPISWDQIEPKVNKAYNFTLSKPGFLTFEFETHVKENVFYHQDPQFSLSKKSKDGKWRSVWVGYTYNTNYHGGKLRYGLPRKLKFKINPDGTLKYYDIPSFYEAGTYKVTFHPAEMRGTYDLVFVKCKASLKVHFMEKGAKVINTPPISDIDKDLQFGKNWHVNEKIKLGLAKVVRYIKRRANDLKHTDIDIASMLMEYAVLLEKADIYNKERNWFNPDAEAATSFLGNITLYNAMTQLKPFNPVKADPITDNDLGIVASLLLHELEHAEGGDEWAAHDIQRETFKALKVDKNAYIRYNVKQFFKRFPEPSILVKFYWF